MATRFAISNGNWSNTAIWDSGSLPLSTDDIYSNGFTITVDQNITVKSLRNTISNVYLPNMPIPLMTGNLLPSGEAFAGQNTSDAYRVFDHTTATAWVASNLTDCYVGYQFPTGKIIKRYYLWRQNINQSPQSWVFEGSNDGVTYTVLDTVTANVAYTPYTSGVLSNTTSYTYYRLRVTAVKTGTVAYIYNLEMTESTGTTYGTLSGGKFDVNTSRDIVFDGGDGIVTAGAAAATAIILAINANSPDVVNLSSINGGYILGPNQISSANQDTTALRTYGTCVLNYIGDVYPPSFGYSRNGNFYVGGNNTVNIIGNVYGPTFTDGNVSFILNLIASAPTVNITGNVYGPTGNASNRTIQMSSANGILNVTGNIISQLGSCINMTAGILNHTGTVQMLNGNARPAVISTSTGICKFTSPFINYDGVMAVNVFKMQFYSGSTVQWLFQDTSNVAFNLYSANVTGSTLGLPLTTDVRGGINFGTGGELTGTLIVPAASDVRVNVPFDNTVGTAELTANDFLNAISASTHPVAVRLRNVATVDTVGAQFSAFTS